MYLCLLLLDEDHWRSYFPTLEELPEGWPGQESEDGLREEHLSDCKWKSSSSTLCLSEINQLNCYRLAVQGIQGRKGQERVSKG